MGKILRIIESDAFDSGPSTTSQSDSVIPIASEKHAFNKYPGTKRGRKVLNKRLKSEFNPFHIEVDPRKKLNKSQYY